MHIVDTGCSFDDSFRKESTSFDLVICSSRSWFPKRIIESRITITEVFGCIEKNLGENFGIVSSLFFLGLDHVFDVLDRDVTDSLNSFEAITYGSKDIEMPRKGVVDVGERECSKDGFSPSDLAPRYPYSGDDGNRLTDGNGCRREVGEVGTDFPVSWDIFFEVCIHDFSSYFIIETYSPLYFYLESLDGVRIVLFKQRKDLFVSIVLDLRLEVSYEVILVFDEW